MCQYQRRHRVQVQHRGDLSRYGAVTCFAALRQQRPPVLPRGVRRPSCLIQPVSLGSTSSSDNSSPCLSNNVFVCTACPVFPVARIIQSLPQLLFLSEEVGVQRGEITRAGSDGQDENPSPHSCFSPLVLHMSSRRERRQQAPVWRTKPRAPWLHT